MNHEMIEAVQSAPSRALSDYVMAIDRPGLVLEFGVHVGGTIRYIAGLTERPVIGFDSFEGLPEDWQGAGGVKKGHFACEPPIAYVQENVLLVKGWFEDTLPAFAQLFSLHKIALVHIDCDVGSGAVTIFKHCRDMFQDGTIVVFDELMGYPGWEDQEFKAFNDFLDETDWGWECIGLHAGSRTETDGPDEIKCAFRLRSK